MGGPSGGMGGGADMGGGSLNMDSLGGAGTEDMGDIGGEETESDMSSAPNLDNGGPMESVRNSRKPLLNEAKSFMEQYFELLEASAKNEGTYKEKYQFDFESANNTLNEQVSSILDKIDSAIENTRIETGDTSVSESEIVDYLTDDEDDLDL